MSLLTKGCGAELGGVNMSIWHGLWKSIHVAQINIVVLIGLVKWYKCTHRI